jgi:hypothetical protein
MEILKFDNAATPRRKKSNGNLKSLAGLATVAAIAVLGSTLAANISLGESSGIEFGQGVQTTAACDSDITVTPTVRFINAAGAGTFYLSTISLSSIDASSTTTKCRTKTFTLGAYNDTTATPLQIATAGTGGSATAVTQATFAITGATAVGTGAGISASVTNGTAYNAEVVLGFGNPSATSGAVYKITLQSQ